MGWIFESGPFFSCAFPSLAAHDLCAKLAPYRKQHHLQATVGHYGVFNGKRWERQIYPRLRDFIHAFDE